MSLNNDFVRYRPELINGWTGNVTIALNLRTGSCIVTGAIIGADATSEIICQGFVSTATAYANKAFPIPVSAVSIQNQGITWKNENNKWYVVASPHTTVGITACYLAASV